MSSSDTPRCDTSIINLAGDQTTPHTGTRDSDHPPAYPKLVQPPIIHLNQPSPADLTELQNATEHIAAEVILDPLIQRVPSQEIAIIENPDLESAITPSV